MGDRWLITVREDDRFPMDTVRQRWDRSSELAVHGVSFLLYGLLDVVVDGYFDVVRTFDEYYDEISESIFDERPLDATKQRDWFHMRRALVKFHRLVVPMRETVSGLMRREQTVVAEDLYPYYQDVYDHVLRVSESTDSLRDLVATIVETNLSLRDYRQNQIMKKVTSWAAIIAVPRRTPAPPRLKFPPGGRATRGTILSSVLLVVAGFPPSTRCPVAQGGVEPAAAGGPGSRPGRRRRRGARGGVGGGGRRPGGGPGEARPSLAEAAAEIEGIARRVDRGVVELVGAQTGPRGAEWAGDGDGGLAVAEREPVGHARDGGHDAGHRPPVDGPREPEQATAFGPGGHPRGDGMPDRGEERLVACQAGGVDLGEATADDEAVDGIGEAPVGQGVERHDLGASGPERIERVGVCERERPPGGHRDANGWPGGGHSDLIDRQPWGRLRQRGTAPRSTRSATATASAVTEPARRRRDPRRPGSGRGDGRARRGGRPGGAPRPLVPRSVRSPLAAWPRGRRTPPG